MYFQKVRSPLKRGVDVSLGPRTVLVGRNGAGKTSVIQALELATIGQVNELEGRDNVKASRSIGRLFDSEEIWAEAVTDDGELFRWTPKIHNAPKAVRWPVQEITALLRGEEPKVRAWLESQVSSKPSLEDILSMVDAEVHDVVKKLARRGANDLLELAKAAKDESKTLRTQATKAEKTIDKMVGGIAPPLLSAERQALEATARKKDGISPEEHQRAASELAQTLTDYLALEAELEGLPDALEQDTTIPALVEFLQMNLRLSQSECLACGQSSDVGARLELVSEIQTEANSALKAFKLRQTIISELKSLQAKAVELDKLVQQPIFDMSGRDAALRALAADDISRRAWDNANKEMASIKKMRAVADHLTDAAEQFGKKGMARLKHQKLEFEANVSKYLPRGELLGVDLESARVGLLRGKSFHSALSGAESTRVLLALCSATSDSTLSVLVPGDRNWDMVTLEKVMRALAESPSQIILMSTSVPPSIPGWTIVEVENAL